MRWRLFVVALLTALMIASNGLAGTPKKLLLIGQGPDGHPPQTHEYVAGLKVLRAVPSTMATMHGRLDRRPL